MGPPQQLTEPSSMQVVWDMTRSAVRIDARNDVVRIALTGELDLAAVPDLQKCFSGVPMNGGQERLLIDLRDVTFLDASGLHVLMDICEQGKIHHHQVVLVGAPSAVVRLFELTGNKGMLDRGEAENVMARFTAPAGPGTSDSSSADGDRP